MEFTKINKKTLIALIVVSAVILIAGFVFYKYLNQLPEPAENYNDMANTENLLENQDNNVPQFQVEAGGIQAQGENGGGGLTICLDKCGDNVCQEAEECADESSLNCVCLENAEECPQDCN